VEFPLLRPIPGATPIHRLWAGTKLAAVIGFGIALSINPRWPAIGIVAAVVLASIFVARIPGGAWPRLPRILVVVLVIGAALTLRAGGSPVVHIGSVGIGLGGIDAWCRFISIPVVLLASGALLTWTTPLGEIAPALTILFRPLAWLRLPVDTWAAGIALSLRCLPTLIDEIRTLLAARRLRPAPAHRTLKQRFAEPHDLLVASLVVSLRRAGDVGRAIEARGGLGTVADSSSRPARRDAVALVVALAAVVFALLL
jgi:energy-coupling factor transport system permease protein